MTINKEHKKHIKLERPNIGHYGRCEVGILGATCDRIKQIVEHISINLSPEVNLCYIDADHHAGEMPHHGTFTDAIHHHRLQSSSHFSDYDQKLLIQDYDVALVNCNHFDAVHQIVCCTEKKKDSLSRKLDKLTDVKLILLDDGVERPFDFLHEIIAQQQPIVVGIHDIDKINDVITVLYEATKPTIKMLILAGGRSARMGTDKAMLQYHGLPQWQYLVQIAQELGITPYISCRPEQSNDFPDVETITDTFIDLGPYGAILSAFRSDPNAAWLSVACDLPLLAEEHIRTLITSIDYSKTATSYHNPTTSWPEPMLTAWMPRAYTTLLKFLSLGYSCPRKVLINSEVHQINASDSRFMLNANTPADRQAAERTLGAV